MNPPLLVALGLAGPNAPRLVQLLGAGGKTTSMYALCGALHARGERALSTTTTRILEPTAAQSPALVLMEEHDELPRSLDGALAQHGHVTLARARLPGGKLAGVAPVLLRELLARDPALRIVAECDGAQGRSLKAHAAHEPVLLDEPSLAVAVVGLDALGAPLDDGMVHRAPLLAQRLEEPLGAPLTPAIIARAVEGYLERIPSRCTAALLLTKPNPERRLGAERIARALEVASRTEAYALNAKR
jgi:probable selenium-dependent hydroxylase accessory protein YqeC